MNEMNRNTISVTEYRALFIRLQLLSGLVHCSAMNYDYNIIKRNLEKSSASHTHTHTRIKNGVGRNRSVNWSFLALKQTESNESFKKNQSRTRANRHDPPEESVFVSVSCSSSLDSQEGNTEEADPEPTTANKHMRK